MTKVYILIQFIETSSESEEKLFTFFTYDSAVTHVIKNHFNDYTSTFSLFESVVLKEKPAEELRLFFFKDKKLHMSFIAKDGSIKKTKLLDPWKPKDDLKGQGTQSKDLTV